MLQSPKLYHYWRSSCSWRVRWACNIKNLKCEFIAVNLLNGDQASDAHLKRNPMGLVPAFEFISPDGRPRVLTESIAIIEFLEEIIENPPLLPKDPLERAQIRRLVETINSGTQPLQNLGVTKKFSESKEEQKEWSRHWINRGLRTYETLLGTESGKFSFGDTVTIADLALIPQVYNALRNDVDMAPFPKIQSIYNKAMATPECAASGPATFDAVLLQK